MEQLVGVRNGPVDGIGSEDSERSKDARLVVVATYLYHNS